jgi:hypothetical protein
MSLVAGELGSLWHALGAVPDHWRAGGSAIRFEVCSIALPDLSPRDGQPVKGHTASVPGTGLPITEVGSLRSKTYV